MKKISILLILCIISLCFTGCSGTSKSKSASKRDSILTEEGIEFAKQHADDERITAFYEAEKITMSADWTDITKSCEALDELMKIAKKNNLSEIKDTITDYKEQMEKHNLLLNDIRINTLASDFAEYLVAKIFYEENDYQYPLNVNVFDYITYCEAEGLTSEKITKYDGIKFQLYDGDIKAGRVSLDFNHNVYSVSPDLYLLDSVLTKDNRDAFIEQTTDEQIDKFISHILNYVSSTNFYWDMKNSRLSLLVTDEEINELYNALSTLSYERLNDFFANSFGLSPMIYIQTDNSVIQIWISEGEIYVNTVYNKEFYKNSRYENFINYAYYSSSNNDKETEETEGTEEAKVTSDSQSISSLDEFVEGLNKGNSMVWAIYATNPEAPVYKTDTTASSGDGTVKSDLEQKLFDSVNYALSIGADSNCDMSQADLKTLYEAIGDGSFFKNSLFEYVTEYGRNRYNYDISYDDLSVTVYYDYTTDLYGFDVREEIN